jgi:hypothetical protein
MMKNKSIVAVGVLMGTASFLPAMAQDDYFNRSRYVAVTDRVQPEFDPEPLRLGSTIVDAQAEAGVTSNSNIFASDTAKESDVIARIGGSLNARSDWNVHQVGAQVSAYRNEYADFDNESNTELHARATGRLDVSREFAFTGSLFADDYVEPRYNFSNQNGLRKPIEVNRYGGTAGAQYQSGRVRVTGDVGLTDTDYVDGELNNAARTVLDQDFRDVQEISLGGRFAYAVNPDVAVFTQARVTQKEHDVDEIVTIADPNNAGATINVAQSRDSDGYSLEAGVNFELQALFRGDVAIGYFDENRKDNAFNDVSGLSVDANLKWFPTQITTVSFLGNRRVEDQGIREIPNAVVTRYGARVDHELRRNIILSGGATVANYDYDDANQENDLLELEVSATYKMNKRAHFEVFAQRRDRDASSALAFANNAFEQNMFGIRVVLFP